MMRKIVVIMVFFSTFLLANSSCSLDSTSIVKKLEKQYAQELKGLDFNFEEGYRHLDATCEKIPKTNKVVFAFPYAMGDENAYALSIILAIVESKTNTIEQSYFHKEMADSDAIYISGIEIDTSLYKKNILKLAISFTGSSRANPYSLSSMFLYAIKDKSLKVILDGFEFSQTKGENNMCYYHDASRDYSWKNKKDFTLSSPMVFDYFYAYEESDCENESNEKHWSVKLEPLKLVFKDGKYKVPNTYEPIFNLKEVEVNVKKGLNYKEVVLNAMLFEEFMCKKNVNHYNNIAYYLQKAGHNREAIVLLEKIIEMFPKRLVAYYNLGDAYWALGKKSKAQKYYGDYMQLMKIAGKEKKIPKVVKERYNTPLNSFEKGFVAVHKKVQSVAPLLLQNKGMAKPIATVPWLQKKLFHVDDANDGKIMKVIAYEENGKMEFVYFLISTVKNEVGLVKLFGIDQEENRPFLIGKVQFDDEISEESIDYRGFVGAEYDEFLVEDGYVYFDIAYDNYDAYYKYRYKLGTREKPHKYHYTIKCCSWHIYSHSQTKYAIAENGSLQIKEDTEEEHSEFVTKDFKNEFVIGSVVWSEDDKILYFDNYGASMACIWRYDLETKELSKIVPEHEAEHPFAFSYKGKEYVVYVEGQEIKVARESKKGEVDDFQ